MWFSIYSSSCNVVNNVNCQLLHHSENIVDVWTTSTGPCPATRAHVRAWECLFRQIGCCNGVWMARMHCSNIKPLGSESALDSWSIAYSGTSLFCPEATWVPFLLVYVKSISTFHKEHLSPSLPKPPFKYESSVQNAYC